MRTLFRFDTKTAAQIIGKPLQLVPVRKEANKDMPENGDAVFIFAQ